MRHCFEWLQHFLMEVQTKAGNTSHARVIATWRLRLRAPLVARTRGNLPIYTNMPSQAASILLPLTALQMQDALMHLPTLKPGKTKEVKLT